jgi:beta-glucosidase
MKASAVVVALMLGAGASRFGGQTPASTPPYLDPDLPAEQRAKDLVSRMTLDQRVRQMQNNAPAIPELKVPAYNWWNEALHGVARAGQATVFPQAIGLAATWDTDLMFRVADAISTEARAKYNEAIRYDSHAQYYGLTFWSPNINIFRDPRWGRGQETYGEDPFLTGRLAVAFIKGLQGDDPKYFKVIATAKHFAVHSGPESTRHSANVEPSLRDLNETYLPAFRVAMTEGKAYSLMCAYNRVHGTPACANTDLLQRTLRDDWGFAGYVVSDCGAVADVYRGHRFKLNAAQASAAAVWAGTDLTCGNEYVSLVGAVRDGLITEAEIDRSVQRLFVARIRLGMFDPPERVPYSTIPYSENDSAAHRALALEAARRSIVLLKNDHQTLPLASSIRTIAVIGPSADDEIALLGNYNGFSTKHVTPLEGLRTRFAGAAEVRFALGAAYVPGSAALISSDALTPPDGAGHGVLAEYFDNADLQNTPKLTRVEPRPLVPNVRDAAVSAARIPELGYSMRWTGTLRPPVTGEYVFSTQGGGKGVRMFLDDGELAKRSLDAGQAYRFRVEYRPVAGSRGALTNNPMQVQWLPPAGPLLAEAVDLVKRSDVTIALVGLNPRLEGEQMSVSVPGFKGGDRTDIGLPDPQVKLLGAALATGKPVVIVLTSGSAVGIGTAAKRAVAVLAAWYGGEEIGTAIAETIAGTNNPAGRLPVTFYRDVKQLPRFDNYSMRERTYRYFTGDPLYAFGYGLSYSTFQYSDLRADRTAAGAHVTARVKNTSARDGDEVVELYVRGGGAAADPIRELKGFQRVHLRAGESRDVEFTIGADALPKSGAHINVSVGGGQPTGATPHVDGTIR